MDKRFQIFISSTFTDLVDERQAVLKAILEVDHMPAGMELFPASDDTAWQLIRDVIDASDYYVLIVGGRYGSQDDEGVSYTQKEYDYATQTKKPVVALLHGAPESLPRERTEAGEGAWEKLKLFRKRVEAKHTCTYWSSPEDLKAKVIVGLTSTMKRHPAVGWIRADQVPSGATLKDIIRLRDRVAELEDTLRGVNSGPPPGAAELLQGDDAYSVLISFSAKAAGANYMTPSKKYRGTVSPSWNELFGSVAPLMINEAADGALKTALRKYLTSMGRREFEGKKNLIGQTLSDFSVGEENIDTCIVQLRALGLIRESDKKRSVTNPGTYWTLTPYGDQTMVQLRALRKNPPAENRRVSDEARIGEDEP